jgi:hypothetical protein
MAGSREQAASQCAVATWLLKSLGFLVNYTKSQILPSQEVTFSGLNIDSMRVELSRNCIRYGTMAKRF